MSFNNSAAALAVVYSECINACQGSLSFDNSCNALKFAARYIKNRTQIDNIYDCYSGDIDNFIDDSCSMGKATTGTMNVRWDVLIMPHPVYGVPCPYIEKMWNENGQIFNLVDCQLTLNSIRNNYLNDSNSETFSKSDINECKSGSLLPTMIINESLHDNRFYNFGILTPESHPLTDLPCFSMHICQLPSILQLGIDAADLNGGSKKEYKENLYLLNWCTVVGPHFGMFISPAQYKSMSEKLSDNFNL